METDLLSNRTKGRPPAKEKELEDLQATYKKQRIKVMARMSKAMSGDPTTTTTDDAQEQIFDLHETENPPDADLLLDAAEVREALKVDDSENILLAVAWVSDEEARYFHMFPEVSFADTAQKVNLEKRPCFIICGKDSENRSFSFLTAFIPSECRWVFQWLFSKAMPALLGGKESIDKIVLMMTDGDHNEYGPIEDLMRDGQVKSIHGLCGFHLVDRSLVSCPFGSPGPSKQSAFKVFIKEWKAWLYSWMNSVETLVEFEVSKALLFEWAGSEELEKALGRAVTENIKTFLIQKILPFIDKTLLCHRLRMRTIGEYCNCVAEIEFSSYKRSGGVMPYMPIAMTARNMKERSSRRTLNKARHDFENVCSTPLWSTSK
jgi:hypothetical protein